jgi:multimeric flavodoxin WrbA
MNILVLNGSPKGDNSVTVSYIKYLKVIFPEHDFKLRHVAQSIHRLEKDHAAFDALMNEVWQSEILMWAFPLYFLLVHSNYKRFIELIFEREQMDAFIGKYTTSFSTSIHFYDHTAHNYMRGICEDLGMNYLGSFSAGMQDLMDEQQRNNLRVFIENMADACKKKVFTAKVFPRLKQPELKYQPASMSNLTDQGNLKIVVLTDTGSMSDNLRNMLQFFNSRFARTPEVIDLTGIKIAGGCLGCVKCGMDNECTYDGKDDVRAVYEEKLKKADIIVFALTMKDRYFSARWKNFLDRRFYQTHQPGLPGKQIGYLISGPLSYEQNLRQILLASSEIDQANLVDIITDEIESSAELDRSISDFAEKAIKYATLKVKQPRTFLGVGGSKIFRDEMWGDLRFIFQADYRYYKKHGMIDFPQSKIGTRAMNFIIPIFRIGPVKKQIQDKTAVMMHRPHDLVIKQEEEKKQKRKADL